jgi:hypothetical protein
VTADVAGSSIGPSDHAPAAPTRVAGFTWAVAGLGIFGGLLWGALIGGGFGWGIENIAGVIEAVSGGVLCVLGAWAFAKRIGRRVRLSGVFRWGLATLAIVGGFFAGLNSAPDLAQEGPDDLSTFLEPGTGLTGLILVACVLAMATVVSMRRFPPAANPEHEPTIEELVYGRRR